MPRTTKKQPPVALPVGSLAERRAALVEMVEYGSHAAYDRELAERITRPFGFLPSMHVEIANDPRNPKGLWVEGLPAKTKVERIGGWTLAAQIARRLGVAEGTALGRGTAFRMTVANITAHLDTEDA